MSHKVRIPINVDGHKIIMTYKKDFDRITYIEAHKWWDRLTPEQRLNTESEFRLGIDESITSLVFNSLEDKIYMLYCIVKCNKE